MFETSTFFTRHSREIDRSSAIDTATSPALDVRQGIAEATKVVTPSWPLSSIVAVNPFWNFKNRTFYEVLSQLSNVYGQNLFLPLEFFDQKYREGRIKDEDLRRAISLLRASGIRIDLDLWRILRETRESTAKGLSFYTYADFYDETEKADLGVEIVDQVARFCASYFDQGQASFALNTSQERLYYAWLSLIKFDRSLDRIGYLRPKNFLDRLPRDPVTVITECSKKLGLDSDLGLQLYLMKVCHKLMGWSSHVQHHHWQQSLGLPSNHRGTTLEDLIAIFMVYECWIKDSNPDSDLKWVNYLEAQLSTFTQKNKDLDHNFLLLSIWQRALEWSYQKEIVKGLEANLRKKESVLVSAKKLVQMVFCIDVRSEVIRRKIEAQLPDVSTHGFAGFFGVSLNCSHNLDSSASYRCPVLLTPKIDVTESPKLEARAHSRGTLSFAKFLSGLKQGIASSLAYVELFGVLSGIKILKKAVGIHDKVEDLFKEKFDTESEISLSSDYQSKLATADFALTHMGIRDFAPVVLICGHGSVTTNNPFGSSLDCGACGGHSGELNARILCDILNTPLVREGLRSSGKFNIPDETQFVPAIHETVSDRIIILSEDMLSAPTKRVMNGIQEELERARLAAQKERAALLQIVSSDTERSTSWSEVRPEWALVKNACFVVAPRARTKGIELFGRSFLHDYDYKIDEGMKTLELIMTAPMVVTNWINMQYYASSVAMHTFGSGNKTIHNVVGRLGVTEGNSGDLRVGLPYQSVHNGETLVHEPLRLSVFIDAPQEEIEKIVHKHQVVRDLVENQWLHIFAINRENNIISYRGSQGAYERV